MTEVGRAFPRVTALRAQRLLGNAAYRIAPAAAAGLMAGGHAASAGTGALVFISVIAASLALDREHYPIHLMPIASLAVRGAVPVVGVGLALLLLVFAGNPEPVTTMVAPVIGTWAVMAFAGWSKLRFESSHRVRIGVIGSAGIARGLNEELQNAGIRSYTVVGWIAGTDPPTDRGVGGPRRLGSLASVRDVVMRHGIDLLVHSTGQPTEGDENRHGRLEVFERVASNCLDLPVRLIEANQLYENLLGHVPLGQSNAAWFQYLLHPKYRAGSPGSKRAFDIVVGSLMLVVASPFLIAFAIAIKLTDGGPILYRQRRVGEGGGEFEMVKLRSMRIASESAGAQWSGAEDDRVTRIGRMMRRTHIDELPQLWNVLKGEMTIVGPRPERRELITELERQLPYYDRRHIVKPGLAGWAQARCGYGGSEEGTGWKLCHDLYYLKHRSVFFDLLILLENFQVSFRSGVQFDVQAPQQQFILGHVTETPGP